MPGLDNVTDFTQIEDGGGTTTTGDIVGFGEGGFGEGGFGGGETIIITIGTTVWTNITTP